MDWLIFLVIAYLLIALGSLVDKFMVTKAIPQPVAYTVLVSTIGLVVIILAPFGFIIPDSWQILMSLVAGATYTLAIFFLYKALQQNEVSRVFTFTGALVAILTFVFSFIFLGERLVVNQIIAFVILVIGGILISLELNQKQGLSKGFGFAALAAVIFAISYTTTKYIYSHQPFISGFVWIRIFAFGAALGFLLSKNNRQLIKNSFAKKAPIRKKFNQLILLGGQICYGLGFLVINYVISLTSAAITLAAQGLQYAFLLIFVIILSHQFPFMLKEKLTPAILGQKIFAIFFIGLGLFFLAFNNL